MIQMAGPWMRPGYLLPVLDLESGQSQRTSAELTTFCIDFAARINQVMGIRPMIYINGNYANYVQSSIVAAIPNLWSARWPNQTDPNSIDVQNGHPKDSYTPIYGPWDDAPNPTHPWKMWQYASTAHVNAIGGGASNCDVDVAQGGLEFLMDLLVPAIWVTNSDGQWTTLTNWNSGQTPVAPVPGPGQVARVGTLVLPTPGLPTTNDTVILDRPSAAVTVTLSSGTHTIRKLYMRESLNITGGSLTIKYVPSWDSTPLSAQFSGPVTLSGSASLSVHTLQVDATGTFTASGGTLTFNRLNLMPGATPAKLALGGDVTFSSLSNALPLISNGSGAGSSGLIDLTGGTRAFNVASGTDLSVTVPISNGGLAKSGLGTMRLTGTNNYGGGTTVSAGKLLVNNASGSGTGSGGVVVDGGILGGTGTIAGVVTVNAGGTLSPGPGSAIGALTLNSAPVFNGTNLVKIDRNGGASLADKLVLSSGTLTYGGTLVVSNIGAALTGGEAFTNFVAPAYAGEFANAILPQLSNGLNWYLGDLVSRGSIKVNRGPVAGPVIIVTNTPGTELAIPLASLTADASDVDGDALTLGGVNLTSTNGVALQTNSTFLFYSNNVNVADRILYTISDGHGGSAAGVVEVRPELSAQFLGQLVQGGSVTIHFSGAPDATYYVERSTDFATNVPTWLTISTNVMPAGGVIEYTDDFHDLSGPPDAAFYRLRW
jgi:autotransporter-associated beta strand protein